MNSPQTLSPVLAPPTILAPCTDLFATRAARLRSLAETHPHGVWLNWLATLCEAQQQLSGQLAAHEASSIVAQGGSLELMQALLPMLAPTLPIALQGLPQQIARLDTASFARIAAGNLLLARGEGGIDARDALDLLIAASQQIAWTRKACTCTGTIPVDVAANRTQCPCCGAAPLGSIIFAGAGKAGVRYLECSLCATRWHAVRARCTLCDSNGVVHYLGLESSDARPAATQAECCPACRGYIKTFSQNQDIAVEPQSDDLATLMLDVLVAGQGYARACPNLLLDALEAAIT